MIRVIGHANGPRLYVLGLRVHHGLTGLLVALTGLLRGNRAVVVAGLAMMGHDAHDWRLWVRIEKCPSTGAMTHATMTVER